MKGSAVRVRSPACSTRDRTGSRDSSVWLVERRDDLREAQMRCMKTGTYARWQLTEAQGETFIDVEFGMDPVGIGSRIFDATVGNLYFRRWLDQSVKALEEAAEKPAQASANL